MCTTLRQNDLNSLKVSFALRSFYSTWFLFPLSSNLHKCIVALVVSLYVSILFVLYFNLLSFHWRYKFSIQTLLHTYLLRTGWIKEFIINLSNNYIRSIQKNANNRWPKLGAAAPRTTRGKRSNWLIIT